MTFDLDWLISVDDHVLEPPDTWQSRVPSRFRESAPRLVADTEGEAWVFEGRRFPTSGLTATAGKSSDEFSPEPITYAEMRPGCYDSQARIEDMNRDHVLASLCFPSFPRFCGQAFYEAHSRDLGLACVRAYNDFMIDEWCGSAPGRFIPLIMIPLWDPGLAVAEIERCAAQGAKALTFSENPAKLGLPSIHDRGGYWDPVWSICQELDMPVCMHLGSSSQSLTTSEDAPFIVSLMLGTALLAAMTCIDWIVSGVLERFPRLKICLSEGGINWIPAVLERLEYTRHHSGAWSTRGDFDYDRRTVTIRRKENGFVTNWTRTPSEIFRDQIYGCFIDEQHGPRNIDLIGIENVMIETDYPHPDSPWPNSLDRAKANLAHLAEEDQWKILRGNAERVFAFQPASKRELPHADIR